MFRKRFSQMFSSTVISTNGDSVSVAGNVVTINGKKFEVPKGKSISVRNQRIYVDGKLWEGSSEEDSQYLESPLEIEWEGDLASIRVTGSVKCGDVHGRVDAGDSVRCGNVHGSVNAGDGVECGDVGGSVNAGDDVSCGKVGGSISAGGDVSIK